MAALREEPLGAHERDAGIVAAHVDGDGIGEGAVTCATRPRSSRQVRMR